MFHPQRLRDGDRNHDQPLDPRHGTDEHVYPERGAGVGVDTDDSPDDDVWQASKDMDRGQTCCHDFEAI